MLLILEALGGDGGIAVICSTVHLQGDQMPSFSRARPPPFNLLSWVNVKMPYASKTDEGLPASLMYVFVVKGGQGTPKYRPTYLLLWFFAFILQCVS